MEIGTFFAALQERQIHFFTGVPDSLLSKFCDALVDQYGVQSAHHIVAHNEGGAAALAAGHYLATGKVPCVYLQNSGLGNIVNPAASLLHPKVYGIPALFVVGWRGEPGTKDEPQHIFQGEATLPLLADLAIEGFVLSPETTEQDLGATLDRFQRRFAQGQSAALVVRKDAFAGAAHAYSNPYQLSREAAVGLVAQTAGDDLIVSSTGKISRELFEYRERQNQDHGRDFLTVGSMGHSAMIALGVALEKPGRRIWCLDGDGAVLMHLGALGLVGNLQPKNYIHVVLNNIAHESVGGMPTAVATMDLAAIARACGYRAAYRAEDEADLVAVLAKAKTEIGPIFVEVLVALGARADLGRPITTAQENKAAFMSQLAGEGR